MAKGLPWFRMYTDFLEDPKLISLAFEDQRHFIAILALKSSGIIDQECADNVKNRLVSQRLWVDYAIISDVKKRLFDAGLIDENWQPIAWEKRQFSSDRDPTGAERQKKYRNNQRLAERNALRNAPSNASVTLPDTDTDTDKHQKLLSSDDDAGSAKVAKNTDQTKLTTADCQEVMNKYNEMLGDTLPIAQVLNASRAAAINARFKEFLNSETPDKRVRYTDKESGIEWFGRLFGKVRCNPHWLGENDLGWTANMDWILKPANFAKILEYTPPRKEKQ